MSNDTSFFKDMDAYKEAQNPNNHTEPVRLGTKKWQNKKVDPPAPKYSRGLKRTLNITDTIKPFSSDVKVSGKSSQYYGSVLVPEYTLVQNWDYNLHNKPFIAGAIDANREFAIVTDLSYYTAVGGTTIDEILWLKDNGYTFKPDPFNPLQTKAIPPQVQLPVREIKDYDRGDGKEGNKTEMWKKFSAIKRQVLAERAALLASPVQPVAATSTSTVTLESSTSTSTTATSTPADTHKGVSSTSSTSTGKYVPPHRREKQEDARDIPTRSSSSSYSKLQSQLGSSRAYSTPSWRSKPAQTSLTPSSIKEPSKPAPPSLSTTTPIQPAATKSWASVASTPPPASTTSKATPPTPNDPPFPKVPPATRADQRGFLDSRATTSQSKKQSEPPKASPSKGYEP